jgi:hypothetical protein
MEVVSESMRMSASILRGVLVAAVCLILAAGAGCATTKKVGGKVGGAFKTAGQATGKAAVTAGKATGKAATWTADKTTDAVSGDDDEPEEDD